MDRAGVGKSPTHNTDRCRLVCTYYWFTDSNYWQMKEGTVPSALTLLEDEASSSNSFLLLPGNGLAKTSAEKLWTGEKERTNPSFSASFLAYSLPLGVTSKFCFHYHIRGLAGQIQHWNPGLPSCLEKRLRTSTQVNPVKTWRSNPK